MDADYPVATLVRLSQHAPSYPSAVYYPFIIYRSIWEWESRTRSCVGFAGFLVVTWHFEPYVIPVILLLFFLRNFLVSFLFLDILVQSTIMLLFLLPLFRSGLLLMPTLANTMRVITRQVMTKTTTLMKRIRYSLNTFF